MATEYTTARLLAESLYRAGLNNVFGIIGTSVIDFIDTLYDYRDKIRFITTRHEQVAVSAADAIGRVTGKPGVAVVHAGPGFLNSMISLGVAFRDRSPLLLVSGGVRRRLRGTSAWLEVDQSRLAGPVSKEYFLVKSPGDLAEYLPEALKQAVSPPKSPIVLEIVEDTWKSKASIPDSYFEKLKEDLRFDEPDRESFTRDLLSMLDQAEKPVILATGELAFDDRFDQEKLVAFAEKIGAYIVTTGNGRGACPEDHPRCLGRTGFGGGTLVADKAFESSDLLIVLGNEFDDITTYAYTMLPEGDILVASLDPNVEKRPAYYDYYRVSPATVLNDLFKALKEKPIEAKNKLDLIIKEARKKWNVIWEEALKRDYKNLPNPAKFFYQLDQRLPRDRVITAGQGTHILYAYSYTRIYKPRQFLAATNLGAMGYAFPAAIGASTAKKDAPIISIVGDGDFMMTVQDLETLVREQLPVKIIVVNDNSYKVLYLRQMLQLGGRIYQTLLGNPDFIKLAEAFKMKGYRIENDASIEDAIKLIIENDEPTLIELPVRPDDLPPLNLEYTLRMSS